jgi:hypothetical protein
MVFHQNAAAVPQLVAQICAEVLPELRTVGVAGGRHLLPHARARGLERARVHVFHFHLL